MLHVNHEKYRVPKSKEIGILGENIACRFLEKRGFKIIERNYLKKYGEIDIVAKYRDLVHFIEVKSVSRETFDCVNYRDSYRPEDNLHPLKLKRLSRVIQTYLSERQMKQEWQFDVITVVINKKDKLARVEIIENVILGE